jgi:hypothetical protein
MAAQALYLAAAPEYLAAAVAQEPQAALVLALLEEAEAMAPRRLFPAAA